MTNPIRPSGPSPSGGAIDAELGAAAHSDPAAPQALQGSHGAQAPTAAAGAAPSQAAQVGSSGAPSPSGSAQVLGQLRSGQLSREHAIDALVSEALAQPHNAGLSRAQRAELAGVLRAALSEDPALGKLLG